MTTTDGLARILDLARAGLDDPALGADELAARAHLSRFHFDRLVRAAGGEARGRCGDGCCSSARRTACSAIASAASSTSPSRPGYGSHEAFTRAFARAHGRTPTALRADPPLTFHDLELPATSGVHFQPPGGLRLPATRKETSMDVLQHLVDHHVDSLTAIIENASSLGDDVLDQPITQSVEGVDDDPTLRGLINGMVTQEEHWLNALRGQEWPDESDQTMAGLAARHDVAGRDYRAWVAAAIAERHPDRHLRRHHLRAADAHTVGGIIGHVITFGAVRRTMAVGALWTAGIKDFDRADPRPYLDGLVGA